MCRCKFVLSTAACHGGQDVLAIEVRRATAREQYEDQVIIHRKAVPGEEDADLAVELRCFPNTPQVI